MKYGKKIIITLATALILSTSVGHAQGLNYTIRTKLTNGNLVRYNEDSNNYLQNRFGSFILRFKPIFNWDNEEAAKPEKPTEPEAPQEPKESEEPVKPQEPKETEKPSKPEEKPEEPVKPEKPEPQEPSKPVEPKPEEPEKPEKPSNPNGNLSIEREVARLVNIERQKAGLAPLTFSEEISKVARIKSQDMADKNYFSHTSPTYGDPFEMMRTFGIKYGYAGENIAKGYRSATSVMNGWMNSSGHRANILNRNFNKIGVGYVEANGTTYWTQMFTD